jgi:hypothetical protein
MKRLLKSIAAGVRNFFSIEEGYVVLSSNV